MVRRLGVVSELPEGGGPKRRMKLVSCSLSTSFLVPKPPVMKKGISMLVESAVGIAETLAMLHFLIMCWQ